MPCASNGPLSPSVRTARKVSRVIGNVSGRVSNLFRQRHEGEDAHSAVYFTTRSPALRSHDHCSDFSASHVDGNVWTSISDSLDTPEFSHVLLHGLQNSFIPSLQQTTDSRTMSEKADHRLSSSLLYQLDHFAHGMKARFLACSPDVSKLAIAGKPRIAESPGLIRRRQAIIP
jgi:hypothetical protein